MTQKIRIGVLIGGLSIEREVSFNSGRTVCDHLDTTLYDVIPVFQTTDNKLFILPWKFLHRGKISDFEHRLAAEAQQLKWDDLKNRVDFVWIAQHGRYAEDGSVQGFLEVLGIPYLGSKVLGSALGMDKVLQKEFLRSAGIMVPKDIVVNARELSLYEENHDLSSATQPSKLPLEALAKSDLSQLSLTRRLQDASLAYPLVIKPAQEGSSFGVSVVFNEHELLPAIKKASGVMNGLSQPVLIEERLEGMEFTCVILINPKTREPFFLPITEVLYEKGHYLHGYEQKYMPGRSLKFTPGRCSQEDTENIQLTCLRVMQALNFTTMGRIDGFLQPDGTVVIIDPNTLCGMAPSGFFFTQAAQVGMGHTAIINYLLTLELQRYGMNTQTSKIEQSTTQAPKKIRVGVLLGGPSNEKETSLDSGRNICYKLSPHKYDVLPLFVDKKTELYPLTQKELVCNATAEIEHKIDRSTRINWHDLPTLVDFVFIGLHGAPGEDGSVQGTLEMLGLPYNGSGIAASALCMDKYKTNEFLRFFKKNALEKSALTETSEDHTAFEGFAVPASRLVAQSDWAHDKDTILQELLEQFDLPVIVKPHDDGCSVMVKKIKNKTDLAESIEAIFAQGKLWAMVEECITGMELTVGVIGNEKPQALPPSQTVTAGDILTIEEKFLPGAGENQTPAPLPAAQIALVQKTMEEIFTALGCTGYVRIDCFYQTPEQSPTGKERVVCLEVNNLPGLTPATCIFHQAAEIGIKPMDFIDMIVTLGFEKHKRHLVHKETIITTKSRQTQNQQTRPSLQAKN